MTGPFDRNPGWRELMDDPCTCGGAGDGCDGCPRVEECQEAWSAHTLSRSMATRDEELMTVTVGPNATINADRVDDIVRINIRSAEVFPLEDAVTLALVKRHRD